MGNSGFLRAHLEKMEPYTVCTASLIWDFGRTRGRLCVGWKGGGGRWKWGCARVPFCEISFFFPFPPFMLVVIPSFPSLSLFRGVRAGLTADGGCVVVPKLLGGAIM